MTFTIDQVKRLVPEAEKIEQTSEGLYIVIDSFCYHWSELSMLLTTRHQLAIAREALEELVDIVHGHIDDGDKLDSFSCQTAEQALDAIAKEGE